MNYFMGIDPGKSGGSAIFKSTYDSYKDMHQRCRNPKAPNYYLYGGRGITIAERWNDFSLFLRDIGPRPIGTTIDRIDVNKNYEPGNCKWSTRSEQQRNRRDSYFITAFGATRHLMEWAEISGISHHTIRQRIENGWNSEEAVSLRPGVKPRLSNPRLRPAGAGAGISVPSYPEVAV